MRGRVDFGLQRQESWIVVVVGTVNSVEKPAKCDGCAGLGVVDNPFCIVGKMLKWGKSGVFHSPWGIFPVDC